MARESYWDLSAAAVDSKYVYLLFFEGKKKEKVGSCVHYVQM